MRKLILLGMLMMFSACSQAEKSFNYEDVESWDPKLNMQVETCYVNEGVTNQGNFCRWNPT